MTGLALARDYWEAVGKPAFAARCPAVLERAAVGLAGEGSECFGFDDAVSRDHDWGPGFCIWLSAGDLRSLGAEAQAVYASLPQEFQGLRRLRVGPETAHRVGVQCISDFYYRFLGRETPPQSAAEWRGIPESGLATAVNGAVFQDPTGEFSAFRSALLAYYPEELRRKKLAKALALAAQAGQYNFPRCLRRDEPVAAFSALAEFVTELEQAVFLLNRRYAPYYKWTHRALCGLPILGRELGPELAALTEEPDRRIERIEAISARVIGELRRQGLSRSGSDFLLDHAIDLQSRITDPLLSRLHLMAE